MAPPPGFLQLRTEDAEKKIYRIFSIQRFLEMCATRQNALVRPALWDDPFENFVLRSTAVLRSNDHLSIGFKDALYGQCWTFQRDSDAMWRIYSPDKMGVRVRTTVSALYDALRRGCRQFADLSCFIGRVQYLRQDKLLAMLNDSGLAQAGVLDPTGRGQASTLLIKRKEFRHEQEVRLIYFNHDQGHTADLYRHQIDPVDLIDEVAFDPRLSDELFKVFASHVVELGFEKRRVIRSPLYRLPALQLHLEGL
jgi:hypothetical protein